MRKFKITGIDRDSGFETTIIVEAGDANLAEMEAFHRGVSVHSCEVVVESNDAATRLNHAMEHYRASICQPPSPPSAQPPPMPTAPDPKPVASASVFVMPPPMYWKNLQRSIAQGIFYGLLLWAIFCVLAAFFGFLALMAWATNAGG